MKRRIIGFLVAGMFIVSNLTGCGASASEPDDYVTNDGYEAVSYTHLRAHET